MAINGLIPCLVGAGGEEFFAVNSANEDFQRKMNEAIKGIPGIRIVEDDNIIFGKGKTN